MHATSLEEVKLEDDDLLLSQTNSMDEALSEGESS